MTILSTGDILRIGEFCRKNNKIIMEKCSTVTKVGEYIYSQKQFQKYREHNFGNSRVWWGLRDTIPGWKEYYAQGRRGDRRGNNKFSKRLRLVETILRSYCEKNSEHYQQLTRSLREDE